eukprot:s1648_g5.t1
MPMYTLWANKFGQLSCSDNQCRKISRQHVVASFQLSGFGFGICPVMQLYRENHQNHQHPRNEPNETNERATKKHQAGFVFCQSMSNVLMSTAKSDAVQFVRCRSGVMVQLAVATRYCNLLEDIWKLCASLFTMFHQSINPTKLNEIQHKLGPSFFNGQ